MSPGELCGFRDGWVGSGQAGLSTGPCDSSAQQFCCVQKKQLLLLRLSPQSAPLLSSPLIRGAAWGRRQPPAAVSTSRDSLSGGRRSDFLVPRRPLSRDSPRNRSLATFGVLEQISLSKQLRYSPILVHLVPKILYGVCDAKIAYVLANSSSSWCIRLCYMTGATGVFDGMPGCELILDLAARY
jgi:hypothetical protein